MSEEPLETLRETSESPPEPPAPDSPEPGLAGPEVRYKRPRSVLVVVYTLAGEFLLLRRTAPAGFWQSVTGSLRPNETPRNAALRELYEETGLCPGGGLQDLRRQVRFPILPAWRARYAPGVRDNLEHWFAVALSGHRLIRLNPLEHSEYRWVSAERALRLASSSSNRDAIRLVYRALIGSPAAAVG